MRLCTVRIASEVYTYLSVRHLYFHLLSTYFISPLFYLSRLFYNRCLAVSTSIQGFIARCRFILTYIRIIYRPGPGQEVRHGGTVFKICGSCPFINTAEHTGHAGFVVRSSSLHALECCNLRYCSVCCIAGNHAPHRRASEFENMDWPCRAYPDAGWLPSEMGRSVYG